MLDWSKYLSLYLFVNIPGYPAPVHRVFSKIPLVIVTSFMEKINGSQYFNYIWYISNCILPGFHDERIKQ